MKAAIGIPQRGSDDALRSARTNTKREAVVTTLPHFSRRRRMAVLTRHLGTCRNLLTPAELQRQRKQE